MQIAHGFGMNVLACDLEHRPGIRYGTLDEVLAQSGVLTLHLPATPATRHFINERRLAAMKPGVILLNTARGSLFDTAALSRALHSGQVSASGLDVAEPASDAESGTALPNTIVTPHIAYNTREAIRRISDITLDNIRRSSATTAEAEAAAPVTVRACCSRCLQGPITPSRPLSCDFAARVAAVMLPLADQSVRILRQRILAVARSVIAPIEARSCLKAL
jgi:phosphoglycerate dehydrogenase-like enzyme